MAVKMEGGRERDFADYGQIMHILCLYLSIRLFEQLKFYHFCFLAVHSKQFCF